MHSNTLLAARLPHRPSSSPTPARQYTQPTHLHVGDLVGGEVVLVEGHLGSLQVLEEGELFGQEHQQRAALAVTATRGTAHPEGGGAGQGVQSASSHIMCAAAPSFITLAWCGL